MSKEKLINLLIILPPLTPLRTSHVIKRGGLEGEEGITLTTLGNGAERGFHLRKERGMQGQHIRLEEGGTGVDMGIMRENVMQIGMCFKPHIRQQHPCHP